MLGKAATRLSSWWWRLSCRRASLEIDRLQAELDRLQEQAKTERGKRNDK